ncbi:DEAD/DEAH box helicase [Fuerstiella marisgermanici]|uniref:RNA polymerase-associated protein RapA n=1 Tax=Fuerstiella marisgermanici TaxID=1891926 RepID=A0A1P8WMQ4_9PLAN|nr:DEAD/DEAH box helicase [Fuerstiella marisgermanici]APZ95352.1 RNA polymerase-associated protein RapA [Fuerstiella marisgermanici]
MASKRNPGLDKSSVAAIKALLQRNGDINPFLAAAFGDDADDSVVNLWDDARNNLTPAELVEELLSAATACYSCHKPALRQKAALTTSTIKFEDIDPEAFIDAWVIVNAGNKRRVEFEFDHDERTFHSVCSCHKQHCVHSAQLMIEIIRQLKQPGSELLTAILGEDHAQDEQQQLQNQTLKMLQQLTRTSPAETVSLDELPAVKAERVVWNLSISNDYDRVDVELKPVKQQEKKTGGWTKGREVGLQTFCDMSKDLWSATDRAIDAKIERTSWYPNFQLKLEDALPLLAGTESFQLNRKPAHLEIRSFEVVVSDAEEGWKLTTSPTELEKQWGGSDEIRTIQTQGGILVDGESAGRVAWFPASNEAIGLLRHLRTNQIIFTEDQRDELLAELTVLQSSFPVSLPESLGGEEIPEVTDLCLLLQMKKTGTLDATVCVRNSQKTLMLPGEGLIRRHDKHDGNPVQLVRDAQAERDQAAQIAKQLNLYSFQPTREWTWQIDDPEDVVSLLSASSELVNDKCLTVIWHKASAQQFNIIGSLTTANVSVRVSKQRDWFGVNGTCKIGDQEIPLQDLLHGLRAPSMLSGFVEVEPGKWAAIADELKATLQRLADVTNNSRGKLQMDSSAAMAMSAIEEQALNIEADKAWQKCMKKVRSIETINPDPPASLDCDLRDYQLAGFRWMCRLAEWGVGGILADDMGLGKTVQALAVLLQRIESGPALVIAPTSLGFNWEQECRRFAPSLTPRLLRDANRTELIESVSEGDVIICSYGLALRETELLQTVNWGTLVLDEAQNIKNSNAKTAKEIRKLKADWKVALTGTPMENHLGELWSIFRAVSPGILGPWEQFRKKFAAPIEKDNDNERRQALSRVISPFILRRAKSEVLQDLPERSETNLMIELTPQERQRYDQVRLAAIGELDDLGVGGDLASDQRFKVLQLLTRLRQLSCHVKLVDENWDAGSSKLKMLMQQLEELKSEGSRPLIFSQFTSHLALIKEACDTHGISYQYLDGQTTPKARQQRVEAFQNGEGDAFLISLKAGGTGLNLTAADYVIHMDPWWNPAVEDQATDRAHRIGQTNRVMVYRIIARDTIEEQILSLHEEKRDLVEGVLSGSEASAKLSTEELAALIRNQGAPV